MPHYRWHGINLNGSPASGKQFAATQEALNAALQKQHIALLEAHPIQSNNTLTLQQLHIFFDELATLSASGIPLSAALATMSSMHTKTPLEHLCTQLITSLEQGLSLSNSIELAHFPVHNSYTALIHTGEITGQLSIVLRALADHYAQCIRLHNEIRAATIVPTLTLVFSLFIITGIMLIVVPQFGQLLSNFDKPIPSATKTLLYISAQLRSWQGISWLAGLIIISYSLILRIRRSTRITKIIITKIPLYKLYTLTNSLLIIRLCITVGMPITNALAIASKATDDPLLQHELAIILQQLQHGASLSLAITQLNSAYFSPDIQALIHLGEQTGNLASFISKAQLAVYKKLQTQLAFITNIIQPALIIVVGVIIGALLIILYLPIFSLASAL